MYEVNGVIMSDMNKYDIEQLDKYNSLKGLDKEKYLEEQGLVMLESTIDTNTKEAVLTFEISHKYQSFIILMQQEGETFENAFSRIVTEALTMFIDSHKDIDNGESS